MTTIKNYTTKIKAHKTIGEIELLLTKSGAVGIMKKYDMKGNPVSMVFSIKTDLGLLNFKFPCNFEKLQKKLQSLKKQGKLSGISYKQIDSMEQVSNVGWRLLKDWISIQLSFIQIDMVSLDQIFLPYMYNPDTEETFYEILKTNNFKMLKEGQS